MPAAKFAANPLNARTHPKLQQAALVGSLTELGWIQNVIVNKTTGNVVDGHARIVEALKLGGDTPVPYVEVELSEAEERLALATLDPISAMAGYDKAQLDALLRDVNTGDAALQTMLAELAQDNGLEYGDTPNFLPAGVDEQGRLDQKAPVRCPHCGAEFQP
jgi:ParB-like chromosome segregation protein Spo0J